MHAVKVAHVFPVFRSLGGVEAVLQHHYACDHRFSINSEFVGLHESPPTNQDRLHFLAFEGRTSLRTARGRFANAFQQIAPEVTVYHGMWGMPFWLDLDRAARRLLILHGHVPRIETLLKSRTPYVDGILCVSEALRETVKTVVPHFDPQRLGTLPYPIQPPEVAANPERPVSRPIVLGFCGRLVREAKRVERLPALCQILTQLKVDFRFEFLGEGPEEGWLRKELDAPAQYRFHGRRHGREYWDVLRNWDVIVFVSDYEGTPIALLEALSQGIVPVFPDIGSGGDAYTQAIDPDLVYPAGNLEMLGRLIAKISRMPGSQIHQLRNSSIAAVKGHLGFSYLENFSRHLEMTRALPRVSKQKPAIPPWMFQMWNFRDMALFMGLGRAFRSSLRKLCP
jgi:glycosyltransferase involved in cell wall biosynthesis